MKKKILLFIFLIVIAALTLGLVACDEKDESTGAPLSNEYNNMPTNIGTTGEIGSFAAVTPTAGEETYIIPTFEWQAATGADTYTLEVASTDEFSAMDDTLYVKKTGITTTYFNLSISIKDKNRTYYWRVTAKNKDHSKVFTNNVESFYLAAVSCDEMYIDTSYADEWKVHEDGSKAKIYADKNDFFGNGKDSIVVQFEKEDTERSDEHGDSAGWIVVTHSQEMELYGVDAFRFNLYYAGNDSRVFLRVIDEDNEYWHTEIKLSTNSKQDVIVRFSEFELREKGGTPIVNQQFDYNYIKAIELVFEESFGDGILYFNDLHVINFDNYKSLYISEVDFNDYTSGITFESYKLTPQVEDEGKTLTCSFNKTANALNASGINGYGLIKATANKKVLPGGDAFEFDLAKNGNFSGNILLRFREEDGDLWIYKQDVKTIPSDGHFVVPFQAFTLVGNYASTGDGVRQFTYIKTIEFGVNNVYGVDGSVSISNLAVTKLADELETIGVTKLYTKEVGVDGIIDNFDGYANTVDAYYAWDMSRSNKDELIALDASQSFGGKNTCASFGYKSDMGCATYGKYLVMSQDATFNALSFWVKDNSPAGANATVVFKIFGKNGIEYKYDINSAPTKWTSYVVPFDKMYSLTADAPALEAKDILGITVEFQHFYSTAQYESDNRVLIDEITLVNVPSASDVTIEELSLPKTLVLDDFDDETNAWTINNNPVLAGQAVSLSSDTTSGEGKSLDLAYKTSMYAAYSYRRDITEGLDVNANAIKFLLKGDGYATIYLNIYLKNTAQYRYTFTASDTDWKSYTIGFDNITIYNDTTKKFSASNVQNIAYITIGVRYDGGTYWMNHILIDDIEFDGNVASSVNTKTNVEVE